VEGPNRRDAAQNRALLAIDRPRLAKQEGARSDSEAPAPGGSHSYRVEVGHRWLSTFVFLVKSGVCGERKTPEARGMVKEGPLARSTKVMNSTRRKGRGCVFYFLSLTQSCGMTSALYVAVSHGRGRPYSRYPNTEAWKVVVQLFHVSANSLWQLSDRPRALESTTFFLYCNEQGTSTEKRVKKERQRKKKGDHRSSNK
jgi:hypothetical protein